MLNDRFQFQSPFRKKLSARSGPAASKTTSGDPIPPEIATSAAAAPSHTETIPYTSRKPICGATAKQNKPGVVANAAATAIGLCAAPLAHAKSAATATAASQNQQASISFAAFGAAFAPGVTSCCVDTRSGPANVSGYDEVLARGRIDVNAESS